MLVEANNNLDAVRALDFDCRNGFLSRALGEPLPAFSGIGVDFLIFKAMAFKKILNLI